MKKNKYAYLCRMARVILLALFIPIILFLNFFINRSFLEIENSNQNYSESLLSSFTDVFLLQMEKLKQQALEISVDSRNSKNVFWYGSERFALNEYWYYETVDEMGKYTEKGNLEAIYYYDSDCIVTNSGTQTSEQYIGISLKVKETDASIWTYFEKDKYEPGKYIFGTTNSDENADGIMLAGYCTTLGKNRDPVLMVSVHKPNEYRETLSRTYGMKGISFYIFNSETKEVYLDLRNTTDEKIIDVYEKKVGHLPLSVVMVVEEDSYQNRIEDFYCSMRKTLLVIIFVLFFICLVVLYVAYKPIHEIIREIDGRDDGEFETICGMLDDCHAKILERENLIIELMLKHLLYGVSISSKKLNQLGITLSSTHYCVFVLEGYCLLSNEIDRIRDAVEREFSMHLIATDWQDEVKNILIVFMNDDTSDALEVWLRSWLDRCSTGKYRLYAGKVVNQLDEIRESFLSCLSGKERQRLDELQDNANITGGGNRNIEGKNLKCQKRNEDIVQYLDIHYRDVDLSLTKVADEFGISRYTLSRILRNKVGIGFIDYVNAKRIESAKELLLITSCSVQEVGRMVGFTNNNYFSRIFKAMVGVTPMEFREEK